MSQMEAELAAASDEIKARKEREKEERIKSTRYANSSRYHLTCYLYFIGSR